MNIPFHFTYESVSLITIQIQLTITTKKQGNVQTSHVLSGRSQERRLDMFELFYFITSGKPVYELPNHGKGHISKAHLVVVYLPIFVIFSERHSCILE